MMLVLLFKKNKEVIHFFLQMNGVLTAEMVSSHVSNLGRFGTGLQHVYHNLSLPVRPETTQTHLYIHDMA